MHRAPAARWLSRALRTADGATARLRPARGLPRKRLAVPAPGHWRANHSEAAAAAAVPSDNARAPPPVDAPPASAVRRLPLTCSGCGAFSQTQDAQQLGFFDADSKRIATWLNPRTPDGEHRKAKQDALVNAALGSLDSGELKHLGLDPSAMVPGGDMAALAPQAPPVCERCHNLMHHGTTGDTAKLTMYHPTVETLRETIQESPHKHNHIYHIIDAADFPMSLIPRLNVLLGDIPLRTRNRRSSTAKYQKGRKTEMSFIITRSDLLAPKKPMVDGMMAYLQSVLRDALGRMGDRVRLGNLRCVSAKTGWWAKKLKQDIWDRGGAGWMVGKVNVGKSMLFEAVFPKGRVTERGRLDRASVPPPGDGGAAGHQVARKDLAYGELLPPPQPAHIYPQMPLVSALPGTTASPIRVPFGNGRGELIDLPGLARGDLELFVKEEHRKSLIMKDRIVPAQNSVRVQQSLVLGGGLIRITPRGQDPDLDLIYLMYNFTPMSAHLTATNKAMELQDQTRQLMRLENIALPGVGSKTKHAGTFKLCHDVTKVRAGPLTRDDAIGLKVGKLPFRVLSVDILIEGVGYVEVVAQVRAKDFERWSSMQHEADKQREKALEKARENEEVSKDGRPASDDPFADVFSKRRDAASQATRAPPAASEATRAPLAAPEPDWPAVDVYTPEGRFVGSRRPISGWLMNKPRVLAKHKKSRPRRAMKGRKKEDKRRAREAAAAGAAE